MNNGLVFGFARLSCPCSFLVGNDAIRRFESGQKLFNQPGVYFIKLKKKLVAVLDGATLCAPVRPVGHQLFCMEFSGAHCDHAGVEDLFSCPGLI